MENGKKNEQNVRPTGIPQLDFILHGGFPIDATVLLAGASGTGKTIFAMEWLFAGYSQFKEPGLYISLTEPVGKALKNAKKLAFFKAEYINPSQIYLTDLRGILTGMGMDNKVFDRDDIHKVVEALYNMAKQSGAKRIVFDSVTAMAYRLKDKDLIRDFIFELGTVIGQLEANILLTSEVAGDGYSVFGVEEFISDGIIKLNYEREPRKEPVRKLEVVKMRGINYETYPASYRINSSGIILFPHLSRELSYLVSDERVSTGVPGLDAMTNGGYFVGSSVLLTGASGSGKTISSLQFLVAGLQKGEKGMYISFEESEDQLMRNASSFGWDLKKYQEDGLLQIIVSYPDQHYLEEHVDIIKRAVDEFVPKRLIIDSLSALSNSFSEDILRDITSRLIAFFKEQQITTLLTIATASLMGSASITDAGLSTMTDHIIMLRYIEINSELKHGLLILKMRGSSHDKCLRELAFGPGGVRISTAFSGYEGVISGVARKIGKTTEDQIHGLFLETFGPMGEKIFNDEKKKGLTPETIEKLANDLQNQGIISVRNKAEFVERIDAVMSSPDDEALVQSKKNKLKGKPEVESVPMDIDSFLHNS